MVETDLFCILSLSMGFFRTCEGRYLFYIVTIDRVRKHTVETDTGRERERERKREREEREREREREREMPR